MAKVGRNLVLFGLSGSIGDQIVISQRKSGTVISQSPPERDTEPTEAQRAHQARFQQAVIYAKVQLDDPASKAEYSAKAVKGRSAYNIAVADFLQAPAIDEIDLTNYNGAIGNTIRVRVVDDFKVQQVNVAIHNSDATLVEQGNAVQLPTKVDWLYTATAQNTALSGDRIAVTATDKPGNISELEQTLS